MIRIRNRLFLLAMVNGNNTRNEKLFTFSIDSKNKIRPITKKNRNTPRIFLFHVFP